DINYCFVNLRSLYSFPTRRSSDLTYTGDTAHHWGAGASHRKSTTRTRSRASLGSGVSIRSRGIHRHPREAPHDSEHESAGEPLRSEEHTSELQSPYDLVCRLLLET